MFISLYLALLFPLADSAITAVVEFQADLFTSAACMSAAPNGKFLVCDQHSQTVVQVSSNGKIEKSFGGQGLGNYEFGGLTDITSSFFLDVFVTDYHNRRVQRFDARLIYVQTIDENSLSASVGRFYPRACAVSSLGDLFVIETDGKRILKLGKRFQLDREFGTYKDGEGALREPKDIAISQKDEIILLDGTSVIVYDIFGNYLRTITLPDGEWRSVQVSGEQIVATAPGIIALCSIGGTGQQIVKRGSVAGIPPTDDFADAVVYDDTLLILTSSTIYFCSVH